MPDATDAPYANPYYQAMFLRMLAADHDGREPELSLVMSYDALPPESKTAVIEELVRIKAIEWVDGWWRITDLGLEVNRKFKHIHA